MSYVIVSAVSMVIGACVGVSIMAVVIAGSRIDDLMGDRQHEE